MEMEGPHKEPGRFGPLLKRKEAAEYLGISERHLWTITDRGDLPRITLDSAVRYSQADLDAYIDRRRQGGRSGSEAA
jgi:excisionase family DNA binding protein